jgi:hypothetical protein
MLVDAVKDLRPSVHPATYSLYGINVRSPWFLPSAETTFPALATIDLFAGNSKLFANALDDAEAKLSPSQWDYYALLRNGAEYVRWNGLFDFIISARGNSIAARRLPGASWETFHTYLLGHVLSYALLKLGIEHLHATVVVIEEKAVGFLGHCSYGKSTLGAAFLQAGCQLLTDDLLVVDDESTRLLAYPGVPRIKLFPEIAHALLGTQASGTPMNPFTQKLVIPLKPNQISRQPKHLSALYVLEAPTVKTSEQGVRINKLNRREVFLSLISNTFNTQVSRPNRLADQFAMATTLSNSLPIKSLSYPHDLSALPEVVKTIRAHLP